MITNHESGRAQNAQAGEHQQELRHRLRRFSAASGVQVFGKVGLRFSLTKTLTKS
jgi:hypothetical protein